MPSGPHKSYASHSEDMYCGVGSILAALYKNHVHYLSGYGRNLNSLEKVLDFE